jgi:hypothetical protein
MNGQDGGQGDPGVNAFTLTTAQFNVPAAINGAVTIAVADSSWMAIGQTLVVDGPATFSVTTIPTGTSVTLQWTKAADDVAAGTLIAAGAKVSPGGVPGTLGGAVTESSPADPTLTASAVGVMMGLAATVTPTFSGRVLVIVTGMIQNDTATKKASVQLRYGTGAAPANGDALTGTAFGSLKNHVSPTGPGKQGFALAFVKGGLTIDTAYWLDVSLAADANNAAIFDVDVVAVEL